MGNGGREQVHRGVGIDLYAREESRGRWEGKPTAINGDGHEWEEERYVAALLKGKGK